MTEPNTNETISSTSRVIAITGGCGSLGAALVRDFKSRGDTVVAIDHSAPAGHQSLADLVLQGINLSDPENAQRAFKEVSHQFGRLDVLINVAGAFAYERILAGSIETWDSMYSANLGTAVVASQAALPLLLTGGKGSIVCIGAQAVGGGKAGMGAYAASKAGVHELVKVLSQELLDTPVTVNAVLPTTLDTPSNRASMPDADFSTWVSLAAVSALIRFLVGDDAREIRGACIPISNRC